MKKHSCNRNMELFKYRVRFPDNYLDQLVVKCKICGKIFFLNGDFMEEITDRETLRWLNNA